MAMSAIDHRITRSTYLNISRCWYLTLLYRSEHYEELITVYEALKEPKFDSTTLAIAALSKIRTKDSFEQVSCSSKPFIVSLFGEQILMKNHKMTLRSYKTHLS